MHLPHIWLRAETKPGEARRALSPADAAVLLDAGFRVSVERSAESAIPDRAYADAGCEMVVAGSWESAPGHCYILGLKELDETPDALVHRHVYFAHAYKSQRGWEALLLRFMRGGGELLDLEYLVDDNGRRLAAFGYWAGYVGAALSVIAWARREIGAEPALEPLVPWPDRDTLLHDARELLERARGELSGRPTMIIIGAGGRVGSGALKLAEELNLTTTAWDIEETAAGGPFPEILAHDLLVNCVLADRPIPPFLTPSMLTEHARKLSVIADVSCDPYGDHNPLPLYDACTTLSAPTLALHGKPQALDLIAIDHLPSLLPRESTEDFSRQLLPVLLQLADPDTGPWRRAQMLFRDKCALVAQHPDNE